MQHNVRALCLYDWFRVENLWQLMFGFANLLNTNFYER